jgi:DNA-binding beta-propeller fold protein YncE
MTAANIASAVLAIVLMGAILGRTEPSRAAEPTLVLDSKIPLGDVKGRLEHMAADLSRGRLFVPELGNNSVGVLDLKTSQVVHGIAGLNEPQGVGCLPASDVLYVSSGGDGSVRLFA